MTTFMASSAQGGLHGLVGPLDGEPVGDGGRRARWCSASIRSVAS
jgi:hypothetical protein